MEIRPNSVLWFENPFGNPAKYAKKWLRKNEKILKCVKETVA